MSYYKERFIPFQEKLLFPHNPKSPSPTKTHSNNPLLERGIDSIIDLQPQFRKPLIALLLAGSIALAETTNAQAQSGETCTPWVPQTNQCKCNHTEDNPLFGQVEVTEIKTCPGSTSKLPVNSNPIAVPQTEVTSSSTSTNPSNNFCGKDKNEGDNQKTIYGCQICTDVSQVPNVKVLTWKTDPNPVTSCDSLPVQALGAIENAGAAVTGQSRDVSDALLIGGLSALVITAIIIRWKSK